MTSHAVHEKKIHMVKYNAKKKTDESYLFYEVADGSPEPPQFKTLKELMDHYQLKPMEEAKP